MKVRKNQEMIIEGYIELNKKFGYGYQGRLVLGVGKDIVDSVIDNEPLELADAYTGMYDALEDIKKQHGYKYNTHKIIHIANDGIESNKSRDFVTARIAADIEKGRGDFAVPFGVDYKNTVVDGKEEAAFTGRGTVLIIFYSWRDEKAPKAKEALQRYCEYLAIHRFGGAATEIFAELESKDVDGGANWIKASYNKCVKNDADLIAYIMPSL